ncbi:MAG: chorismate-binding protein [Candidatus Protistobacter heckmanni]|nr:chorismate-binding protein [Candidatus Protistobacter heckmanni]
MPCPPLSDAPSDVPPNATSGIVPGPSFSVSTAAPFALLDDARGLSRLYREPLDYLSCKTLPELDGVLERARAHLAAGRHAGLALGYEGGRLLQGLPPAPRAADEPWLHLLVFGAPALLDEAGVQAFLAGLDDGAPCGVAGLHPSIGRAGFDAAFARLHAYLAAGDAYQVNFSLRLRGQAYGSPAGLYRRLRESQPVSYGALIHLGGVQRCGWEGAERGETEHGGSERGGAAGVQWLLSRSPELFVRRRGALLEARPMKGTAPRGTPPAALAADPKNRAENLMIVDLLRNDLGRIAQVGSVQAPALFEVEPLRDLWQMTSTVRARALPGLGLRRLLEVLFPCGSITGAPKRRAMQIIDELESAPRGFYTGAIGWIAPPHPANDPDEPLGDFCFSVAIRSLLLGAAELDVGAGVTHDSQAGAEWEECQLKAGFLRALEPRFGLFETLRVEDGVCAMLDAHLDRMEASARALGFPWERVRAEQCVARGLSLHPPGKAAPVGDACRTRRAAPGVWRARLDLDAAGEMRLSVAPLAPLPAASESTGADIHPVRLLWANERVDSADPLLRHKTTRRARFDAAWREAERQGAFDALFLNERGEVTEGGRCNVFARIGGEWLTPSCAAGLLPGLMRAALMRSLPAREAVLRPEDLRRAERLLAANALRGALPAVLA